MSFIVVVIVFVITFIVIVVGILTAAVAHRLLYCLVLFALQDFPFSFFFWLTKSMNPFFIMHAKPMAVSLVLFSLHLLDIFIMLRNFPAFFIWFFCFLSCFFYHRSQFHHSIQIALDTVFNQDHCVYSMFSLSLSLSLFSQNQCGKEFAE